MALEPLQIEQIDRRMELDHLPLFSLTTQYRGQAKSVQPEIEIVPGIRLSPIEDAEDADHLASVASQGAYCGVARESIPLNIVRVRDVPQERITDRRVWTVEDFISDVEELFWAQARIARFLGLQALDDL